MKAVVHILRNAAGVTTLLNGGGNAIYVGHAVQDQEPPYITVESSVIDNYLRKDSGRDLIKESYDVFIYSRSYGESKAIAAAVESALDFVTPGTYNGQVVSSGRLVAEESQSTIEENIHYWLITQRYELMLNA